MKRRLEKLCAFLLSVLILISIVPTTAFAAETDTHDHDLDTTSVESASWDTDGDGVLEILGIGNSFSTDALQYANQIAKSLGIEQVVIGNIWSPGCSLTTHASNVTYDLAEYSYSYTEDGTWTTTEDQKLSTVLASRTWDYVSMQQVSNFSGDASTYDDDLTTLYTYVKNNSGAKRVWHMTWAYQQDSTHSAFPKYNSDQMTMYNAIVSAVQNHIVTTNEFDLIVPSGTAVQNSRTSLLGDTTTRDGYHMSLDYGRYLTGLMYIKTVTGLSVDNITYAPSGVDDVQKAVAIESVNHASAKPFAVTDSELYVQLRLDLTKSAYWTCTTDATLHAGTSTTARQYFATTNRFTKDQLPVGSVITVASGWRYRPAAWTASSNPANVTTARVVVDDAWWGDYEYRAFNISKTDGSYVADSYEAEDICEVFRLWVPAAKHTHDISTVVTPPTCTEQGYTAQSCSTCVKTTKSDYVDALGHSYENGLCATCGEVDEENYVEIKLPLTKSAYWVSNGSSYNKLLVGTSSTAKQFYATTTRFTEDILPEGSFILLADGWRYRPEAWVTDAKQSSRPAEVTTARVDVDAAWWGDYTLRAFNIGLADKSNVADNYTEAAIREVFRTYVPKDKHTHVNTDVVTAPTCTEQGYTTHTCTLCGAVSVDTYTEIIPHNHVDGICTVCGHMDETQFIQLKPALTNGGYWHSNGTNYNTPVTSADICKSFAATPRFTKEQLPVGSVIVLTSGWRYRPEAWVTDAQQTDRPAEINTAGSTVVTEEWWGNYTLRAFNIAKSGGSSLAGLPDEAIYEGLRIYVPISKHTHDYNDVVTEPTCTERGYTTRICTLCGDSTVGSYTQPLGHDLAAVVTDPTCTEQGYTTYGACSRCGAGSPLVDDYVDALGHNHVNGLCTRCGDFKVEDFVQLKPALTNGGYWNSKGTTYNVPVTEGDICKNFAATIRFTRETLPVGSVLVLEEGWRYRPDAWVTDAQQSSRPDEINTAGRTVVTEEWWGDYTLRGFNIAKAAGGSLASLTDEEIYAGFHIYVPKNLHTHSNTDVVTDPTCEDQGYTTHTCSLCGAETVDTYVPALGHDYDSVVTAPTCTDQGYTTHTCKRCTTESYVDTYVPALGHNIGTHVQEPTCEDQGYTTYGACTRCGEGGGEPDNFVPALGHDYDSVVTDPTCEDQGYTTHTCKRCTTESYVDTYVPALGHDYDSVVTEPTCEDQGYTTHTCKRCTTESYVDTYVPVLDHTYVDGICTGCNAYNLADFVQLTPVLTNGGYWASNNAQYNKPLTGGIGKSFAATPRFTKEQLPVGSVIILIDGWRYRPEGWVTDAQQSSRPAEIKTAGSTIVTEEWWGDYTLRAFNIAKIGGTSLAGLTDAQIYEGLRIYVPKTKHTHVNDSVVTEPTCTEQGYTTYICTLCGVETVGDYVNPLDHDYDAVVTEPTCEDQGYTTHTCTRCTTESYVDTYVPALGHDIGVYVAEPTCTEPGYTTYGACTRCGQGGGEPDNFVDALGHDYDSVVTEPTCEDQGYTTHTCKRCTTESYVDTYVPALGHDHVNGLCTRCSDFKESDFVQLKPMLTNGGYWNSSGTKYNEPVTDGNICKSFAATPRFTKEQLPVGSVIILAEGWRYRPEAWVTDTKQASRPAEIDEAGRIVVTEEWWGDYTLRAFNIAKASGSSLASLTDAAIYEGLIIYVPKNLHTHSNAAVVTAPTCEDQGYTTHTCTLCGESSVDTYVDALGHDIGSVVVEPTCTEQGFTSHSCTRCGGETRVDTYVEPLGHSIDVVVVEPTCTEQGFTVRGVCIRCGSGASSVDTYVDALGHDMVTVVTAPTCEDQGYTTHTCARCGGENRVDTYMEALGHKYVNGICTTCGEIAELAIASPEITFTPRADDYYKVISQDNYILAPGISEAEFILNNSTNTQRNVAHVVEVDINNPYTKVMPSYMGMAEALSNKDYSTAGMPDHAAWAEANGYGNVVAAQNLCMSWYTAAYYDEHPELINEPLAHIVMNGQMYVNSQGPAYGAESCLVINFDEKDGVARPAGIPKTEVRDITSPITGWEEQLIPCLFGFLVKDGVNQYTSANHTAGTGPKSVVGVKADGSIVMMMCDGRQAPYSTGFTTYEAAEFMLSLGCVNVIRGDGGGSAHFLTQRPGEELELHCSPSDGIVRPALHGVLVISTAPATGEFVRADVSAEHDYYTPGSTVQFTASGTDMAGTPTEIPADAVWRLADDSMGTITDGVFVSNGKVGKVTALLVYNDEVVGRDSVEIVIPTALTFNQSVMTVPYGKTVNLGIKATINYGLTEVAMKPADITLETTNTALGTFDGFMFTSVSEENAPDNLTSTVTVTLNHGDGITASATLSLGRGSEVLFDFENDVDKWLVGVVNNRYCVTELTNATAQNGQVHDGNGSLRFYMNPITSANGTSISFLQTTLYPKESIVLENVKSIGFWAYVPDDFGSVWMNIYYLYDSDGDGMFDKRNTTAVVNIGDVYNSWEASGWKYFKADITDGIDKILIPGADANEKGYISAQSVPAINNHRFIEVISYGNNPLFEDVGNLNGAHTIYFDNLTLDYSEAVDDREEPVFGEIIAVNGNDEIALERRTPVTVSSNQLSVIASVAEDTERTNATGLNPASAKAYVDGVEVPVTYSKGIISVTNVAVADGMHRVTFEMCDMMGNKAVVTRFVNVQSGVKASTIEVVPADPTLDRLLGGSLYWMNVNATDIETIQSVTTTIDLDTVSHWELDHMILAEGFTAQYSIADESNTATITITRTGVNTQTGKATLASLPIRVVYHATDLTPMYASGKETNIPVEATKCNDPAEYWTSFDFWAFSVNVDVDMGKITYVNGYQSDVLGSFSNEEFSVATEFYKMAWAIDAEDPDYRAQKGTCHVHTPVAMDDHAVTCTEDGYTGRTFCQVCSSVVDWGTTVPATGHDYQVVGGVLKCVNSCGQLFNGILDGKVYIDGVVPNGWVDDTYYYVDGVMITGQYFMDGKLYNFDEDGTYLPEYLYNGFHETPDGKLMYFSNNEFFTGFHYLMGQTYFFHENGFGWEGEYIISGEKCIFDNGQFASCSTADVVDAGMAGETATFIMYSNGTFRLDGTGATFSNTNYGSRPYAKHIYSMKRIEVGAGITRLGTSSLALSTATIVVFDQGSSLKEVASGTFYQSTDLVEVRLPNTVTYVGGNAFGDCPKLETVYLGDKISNMKADALDNTGKLTLYVVDGSYAMDYAIDGEFPYVLYTPGTETGIVLVDGELYYYKDGEPYYAGLIKIDGDYYYANSKGKIATGKYSITKTNDLMEKGTYEFDSTGKMLNVPVEGGKTGIFTEDGTMYYYKDGVKNYAGLIEIDGYYYYVNSKYVVVTGSYRVTKTNGLMDAGTYEFDATGKMILSDKTGIFTENGTMYYYKDGVKTYAGLIEIDGYYYYVNSKCQVVTGHYHIGKTNDLMPKGYYDFDENGRMLNAPVGGKTGIFTEDGTMYYYKDGVKTYAGLIEIDGYYYYVNSRCQVVTGHYHIGKTNDLMPKGYYDFDETGKMLLDGKTGIYTENGTMYYYKDGVKTYAGLIEIDGYYYYVNASCKVVTGHYHIGKTNDLMPKGYYDFDETGKMLNVPVAGGKTGIYTEDGTMYYYKDGEKYYAGLIEIDGYYYYVNSRCQVVTGHYHIGKTNDLMPKGYYDFDETGKMLNAPGAEVKTGIYTEDGTMYYYKDGEKCYAGLIEIDGYYYYVNSSCKVVTGHYLITKTNDLMPKDYYDFDETGKMLNPSI